MDQTFMKERAVLPLVLSMALPMMLSMVVLSLYNIVDSYFVAQISEDAMTALSLVFPVQNFIGAITIGFGVGITAQAMAPMSATTSNDANIPYLASKSVSFCPKPGCHPPIAPSAPAGHADCVFRRCAFPPGSRARPNTNRRPAA